MRKVYRLYLALALFCAVALTVVVLLDRRVTEAYSAATDASERHMRHDSVYAQLEHLAADVDDMPFNLSGQNDVHRDAAHLETAMAEFSRRCRSAERLFRIDHTSSAHAGSALLRLRRIGDSVATLATESRRTMALVREGNTIEAAAGIVRVDRADDRMREQFALARDEERQLRQNELRAQEQRIGSLRRDQLIVGVILALTIIVLGFYGRRLLRAVNGEEELRRANAAFEHALSGAAFVDRDRRFVFVSRPFAAPLGYEPEELRGKSFETVVHPSEMARIVETRRELLEKGRVEIDMRGVRKDGSVIDVRLIRVLSRDRNGDINGQYVFGTDISEQKRAETELRVSNERFALVAKAIKDWIWEEDLITGTSWTNGAFRDYGYPPDHPINYQFWFDAVHPDDLQRVIESRRQLLEGGDVWSTEYRFRRYDGTYADVLDRACVVRGGDGSPLKLVGAVMDLSDRKRAEDALRRSEERFHLATLASNDLVFDWTPDTGECWLSEAWEFRFGHSCSGELGYREWFDAVHPDDRESVVRNTDAAVSGGERSFSCEYRLRRGDGTWADVLSHAYIVRDEDGVVQRVVGATTDVTERKRAERAYNTLLLNCAADGIYGLDLEGRVTFANASAARQLGYEVAELVGKDMHRLAHHHYADGTMYPWQECPSCTALRNGIAASTDREVFWKKDGSSVAVEYASMPIRDERGTIIGAVVTFRDISERKTIERMKNEFVSVVSHELRTPLTSIRGALGLIAGGRLGEIPEKSKHMLDIAVSNTDRLVRLINDILDIEKIESGKIALSRQVCNAAEVVTHAVEVMNASAERANVTLVPRTCDAVMYADPDRLLQTLTNLISNAIKFSPAGEAVTISASTNGDNVVFVVADHGRGIPADKIDVIFERFQQVDASDSREKGGTGLGLAICRSIVRQHGGEISVESTIGQGSRFRFTIPRSAPPALATPTSGRTIIVCDDDRSVREVMCTLLEEKGYRTVAVESGCALLGALSETAPDIILLDLLMPEMNGCEALAVLKGDPRTASIPVVIMSVFSPDDSEWPIADLAGWIQKPFDEKTIVNTLERAMQPQQTKCVLLVEDDADLARVITSGFERYGIRTAHAPTGRRAIEMAQEIAPDLVVLDIILPDIDGYAVVDWLKDHDLLRSVPLVVYSATEPSPSQRDRLTLGPTEFLTKSVVAPDEFEQRVIRILDTIVSTHGEQIHAA